MALGGVPFAPWLMTRPAEHLQASEAGLREGIAAAHIWAQAAAERARLAEAQKRSDMEAALQSERLQQKSIYEAQSLAVDKARNQAAASMAEARLKETQDNAAQRAQQWAGQMQFRQQQLAQSADLAQQRATGLGERAGARLDLARQRAAEVARHNLAMEGRTKASTEDPELAAYAKRKVEPPSGEGFLGKMGRGISDFFTGGERTAGIKPPKVGDSPHAEGTYVKSKKDGKTYVIRGGLPVLVDDSSDEETTPTDEESPE